MKTKILAIITFLTMSCKNNDNTTNEHLCVSESPIKNKDLVKKLMINSINNGDVGAYIELSSYYKLSGFEQEFYFYSLLMANKHQCNVAYFELYSALNREKSKINGVEVFSSDSETQKISDYYLLKAYELNSERAISRVIERFGKNIPKSKEIFCK